MRVFKNSWFGKFARRENISDVALNKAITAANAGLVDANLGGGLIKLPIARGGVESLVVIERLFALQRRIERFLPLVSPRMRWPI